jgi:putative DNA primase/helicase
MTQADYSPDAPHQAIEFLRQLRPNGPWLLVAIEPDGGRIRAVTAQNAEEVTAFVQQYNDRWNLYYSLNPTRAINRKPKKKDIAAIEYVFSDLDPEEDETSEQAKTRYQTALQTFQPAPAALIDSGNGLQVLWRLRTPILISVNASPSEKDKIKDAEARSKTLMTRLGSAAGTQNIDRLLRLPGTINLPDEVKRRRGRVRCEAKLLSINGSACALEDLPKDDASPRASTRTRGTTTELPQELRHMLYLAGDTPAGYPSRSELFWAFINRAVRRGIDENKIVELCLDATYTGYSIYQHVQDNDGEPYVKRQIERALNEPDLPRGEKRVIRLEAGQLDAKWRLAEDALRAARCPVYVRGGALVQPLWRWEDTGEGNRQVLNVRLVRYNVPRLADVTAHHAATFQKYDRKLKQWCYTDPPDKLIERIIEAYHWGFPDVVGIITAPTMRRDGSLITESGYDAATQLWYKPSADIELPTIGTTRAEAEQALADLKSLIVECAFVDQALDKSVALAAMMTVVLRGAFSVAPLFLIHKPEPGTGGSYLVKIISTLALGREAVPLNVSDDPKELVKELSAAAYEAKPILNLNNLTFDLQSSLLSQMITEGQVDIRPFGKNTETVRCDCRAMTAIANGNNIKVIGELVRRTLTCRLDTKLERPETEKYEGDPLVAIKRERGKYLAAVLTTARAFMNSGAEVMVERINGLEQWSKFVQQPLVWLGETDPVKSQEDARARDPERGAVRQRIKAIVKHFHAANEFTAQEVYSKVMQSTYNGTNTVPQYPDLLEAFSNREGKMLSSKSIGWQLSKDEGRVVDGFSIHIARHTNREGNAYVVMPRAAAAEAQSVAAPEPATAEEIPF